MGGRAAPPCWLLAEALHLTSGAEEFEASLPMAEATKSGVAEAAVAGKAGVKQGVGGSKAAVAMSVAGVVHRVAVAVAVATTAVDEMAATAAKAGPWQTPRPQPV